MENARFLHIDMFTVFLYAKPPKNAALKTRAAHVKKTTEFRTTVAGFTSRSGAAAHCLGFGDWARSEVRGRPCIEEWPSVLPGRGTAQLLVRTQIVYPAACPAPISLKPNRLGLCYTGAMPTILRF